MKKQNTASIKLDLVTHPVRLRILLLLAGAQMTASSIAAALDDVPESSVYRHLVILQDAGVLEIVAEQRVRGALQKTLRVIPGGAQLGSAELGQMQPDDYRRTLLIFFTQLFHEFDRYLQQPEIDFARDLAGFRTSAFYATDDEWLAAIQAINAVLRPLTDQQPGEGRKRRRIATITLPTHEEPKDIQS